MQGFILWHIFLDVIRLLSAFGVLSQVTLTSTNLTQLWECAAMDVSLSTRSCDFLLSQAICTFSDNRSEKVNYIR